MSIQNVPGTDLRYYLVAYDKNGNERQDDPDGKMSELLAKAIRDEGITDVFITSHGWKGDIPEAIKQYDEWIKAMADCAADRAAVRALQPDFKALLIGFHWPSQPWGDEEFGMGSAASFGVAGGGGGASTSPTMPPAIETFIDQYADRIADTPRAREAIRTIVTGAMNAGPGVTAMPPEMAAAYRALNEEASLGGNGAAGAPGDDREAFDPDRAFLNARAAAKQLSPGGVPAFGGFSLSGLLSPLRQLSFWQMKARGRKIGETAGATLLGNLMKAVPAGRKTRFHLMGHSFGCIVVSSMVHGENGKSTLTQPVDSLTLVQGATSLWGFCEKIPEADGPGYFRRIISEKRVSGAILTTQSKRDTAVGRFYPIGAGVALQVDFAAGVFPKYGGLGAFGIQGPGLSQHDLSMGDAAQAYPFEPGHIYNFECTHIIKDGSGASGAHSDIAKPEVAHAMWEAVKLSLR